MNKLIKTSPFLIFGQIILVVVVLDQWSKSVVTSRLSEGAIVPVVEGFFNMTLVYNRGAAFGIFAHLPDSVRWPILAITSTIALAAVVYFLLNDFAKDRLAQIALGMIAGGAVGNIIDRISLGKVVDFIDWFYGSYHWPAFNVADSAICVGVVVLIVRKPSSKKGSKASPCESNGICT